MEVGGGAGVFAEAAVEAVFEEGGELGELGFDGLAGGFAFADLLGGFVFAAAKGADSVAQLLEAGLGDAVGGEGRGVGGGGGEDVVGHVEQGGGALLAEGGGRVVGHGLQGAVLLLDGVGVEVAGYFGGYGAEQGFAVGFGESGAGGGWGQRDRRAGRLDRWLPLPPL